MLKVQKNGVQTFRLQPYDLLVQARILSSLRSKLETKSMRLSLVQLII